MADINYRFDLLAKEIDKLDTTQEIHAHSISALEKAKK